MCTHNNSLDERSTEEEGKFLTSAAFDIGRTTQLPLPGEVHFMSHELLF